MDISKQSASVVFFEFDKKESNETLVRNTYKKRIRLVNNISTFSTLFSNANLSFICIDDIGSEQFKQALISDQEIYMKASEGPYHITPESVAIDYFYLNSDLFSSICDSGFRICFDNAGYHFYHGKKLKTFQSASGQNKLLIFDFMEKPDTRYRFETKTAQDKLYKFLIFCVKRNLIQYLCMTEDYYLGQTMYPKTEDAQMSKTDIIDELKAIVTYVHVKSTILLYDQIASWGSIILDNSSHGISIVDKNYTLLYANNKRRIRHKNNILGKTCYSVMTGSDKPCKDCPLVRLFDSNNGSKQSEDRLELRISDKAGNEYWLSESSKVVKLFNGKKSIGVSICRDINLNKEIGALADKFESEPMYNLDEITKNLKATFIEKLGFVRLRIYLNYSQSRTNKASLYLFDLHGNHKAGLSKGFYVSDELLKLPFNENGDTIYKGFQSGRIGSSGDKPHLMIENKQMFTLTPSIFQQKILEPLQLNNKWIDLPIWYNEELIGVIGLDFGSDASRWDKFTNDSIHQLITASNILATAIRNSLIAYSNMIQRRTIDQILRTTSSDTFINHVCEALVHTGIAVAIFFNINKDNLVVTHRKQAFVPSGLVKENISPSEVRLPQSDQYVVDYKIEGSEENAWFAKVVDVTHAPMYSYLYLTHNDNTGSLRYAMLVIRTGDRTVLPLLPDYQASLQETMRIVSTRLQYLDSQKDTKDIIKDITGYSLQNTTVSEFATRYDRAIKEHLRRYLPKASSVFYQVDGDSVLMVTSDQYVPIKETAMKRIADFIRKNPQRSATHFTTLDQYKAYFTPEIVDIIQKEAIGPLIYIPMYHNDAIVGFCLITSVWEEEFDADFRFILEASAFVAGNTLGLLNEYKRLKTNQESFVHDISNPIKTMTDTFDFMIPQMIDLDITDSQNSYKLENSNTGQRYNAKSLFRYLSAVAQEADVLLFFAQNAASRNYSGQNMEKSEFSLDDLIVRICRMLSNQIKLNKPSLMIYWNAVESVRIWGNKNQISLCLFNILDNALKYSAPLSEGAGFKAVNVTGKAVKMEGHGKTSFYELSVKNYGITIKQDEIQKVFNEGYRGTNAIVSKHYGNGLGLASAKTILDNHGFEISLSVNPEIGETSVKILFKSTKKER